jgi:hypothetical protein
MIDELNGEAPEGKTALELHQAVYRDRRLPLHVRLRAAKEALPYETPKLSVTQHIDDKDWGAILDRAIERSHGSKAKLLLMDLRNRPSPDEAPE